MARILIIDDDEGLLDALAIVFEDGGHAVLVAPNGDRGLAVIRSEEPDAVVSDINMPGIDGYSLCRILREAGNQVPIVLLTSRDSEIDEMLGLELGADDYVTKPFSNRVLLARVNALLRRNAVRHDNLPSEHEPVHCEQLTLDLDRLEVHYQQHPIEVTLSEFRLLEGLVRHPGIVMSRSRLIDIIRNDESIVGERIIDTYIRRLRRKFEAVRADFEQIETVVGVGYRWRKESER